MDHCKDLNEGRLDPQSLVGRKVKLREDANRFFGPGVDVRILEARKVHERGDDPGVFSIEFTLGRDYMGRTMKLREVAPEDFELSEGE